jgi:HEAT repeat protein
MRMGPVVARIGETSTLLSGANALLQMGCAGAQWPVHPPSIKHTSEQNKMFTSLEDALQTLDDPQADSLKRVEAVHFLAEQDNDEALARLVTLLEDDDYGVRWAAADALAKKGARGAVAVARGILDPKSSARLYEMAVHVFKDNSDILVRSKAEGLVKALEANHPIQTMTEASNLLKALAD